MELGVTGAPSKSSDNALKNYLRKLCSGVTLQSNKEGFFNNFVRNVQQNEPSGYQFQFSKLEGDLERIKMAWNLSEVQSLDIRESFTGKNIEISEARRQEGNVAFQEKNDRKALKLYTQAVIRAPSSTSSADALSLALANRSAVLFHLKEYAICIQDVTLALEAFLPPKLHYKVLDRRANCHKQLGFTTEAMRDYQSALQSLHQSKLDNKKKSEFEIGIAEKIETLRANLLSCETQDGQKMTLTCDTLFKGQSKELLQASVAIQVKTSSNQGRYVVASTDIPAGAVLVRENPFSSVLLPEKIGLHCSHCYARLLAPISCDTCCWVTFCSKSCKVEAMETYHKWECKHSNLLISSGMALNCYLAMRIITERSLSYFLDIRDHLGSNSALPSEQNPHRCDDYVNVYNLVALEDSRLPEDFFHRSLMAIFLLKVLIASGYVSNTDEPELSNDAAFIGSLLLRHLQVIQFNAHEVSGMSYQGEESFKKCKSVYLGLAIYPTVSFFNHSCYPALGRCFNGKEMTIVSLRPIMKGQPVEENYGPIFTKHDFEERSKKLLSRYWFDCRCEACIGKWPTYACFDSDHVVLKCPNCRQRLVTKKKKATPGGNGPTEECTSCNFPLSAQAIKAKVRKAKTVYDDAVAAMEEGNQSKSVKLFIKYINDVINYVTLPHREIHLALDSLRLLIAMRGANYITA